MMNKLSAKPVIVVAAMMLAAVLAVYPFAGQSANFSQSAAVVLITLVFWSTGLFPPFLTGLLFFALATVFHLIEPSALFAGFGSTAVWPMRLDLPKAAMGDWGSRRLWLSPVTCRVLRCCQPIFPT